MHTKNIHANQSFFPLIVQVFWHQICCPDTHQLYDISSCVCSCDAEGEVGIWNFIFKSHQKKVSEWMQGPFHQEINFVYSFLFPVFEIFQLQNQDEKTELQFSARSQFLSASSKKDFLKLSSLTINEDAQNIVLPLHSSFVCDGYSTMPQLTICSLFCSDDFIITAEQ